jgi:heme-degrading monooxygenase HmoA
MGGNGILLEHNVGRFVADAEAIYSYEGTREMNSLIVGKAITGPQRLRPDAYWVVLERAPAQQRTAAWRCIAADAGVGKAGRCRCPRCTRQRSGFQKVGGRGLRRRLEGLRGMGADDTRCRHASTLARSGRCDALVSFGQWESAEAADAWKASPEFRERMARVQQYVAKFTPAELVIVEAVTKPAPA